MCLLSLGFSPGPALSQGILTPVGLAGWFPRSHPCRGAPPPPERRSGHASQALWTFPTRSSSSSQGADGAGPWQPGEEGPVPGAPGGAGFDLLTIKMSAPLGSFLNQYLLFCG